MKRFIYDNLLKWKKNHNKKPLIIEGARQVGKTYIVSEFVKNEYKKFAYINFDNVNKIQIPLTSYTNYDQFKLYLLDIGLLSNMNHVNPNIINDMDKIFVEYKGQLAEQFVLNELISEGFENMFYYRDEFGKVEIDFMIEKDACIVPIEVKSGINLRAKSFNNFIKKYNI